MARRKISEVSISSEASIISENSADSDHSDNLDEELPDPGLPKGNRDATEKKVKFNFPVEVITRAGKFSGIGSIDLLDTLASIETTAQKQRKKSKLKDVLSHFEYEEYKLEMQQQLAAMAKDKQKKEKIPPPVPERSSKAKEAKKARAEKEVKEKELEAKREAIRKAIEAERAAKAAFEETNKYYKPGECMKYIMIQMSPVLMKAWYMQETAREMRALGVRLLPSATVPDSADGLLVWTRRVPQALVPDWEGELKLSSNKVHCNHALYIVPAEELLALAPTVVPHAVLTRRYAHASLTVIVFGSNAYGKKLKETNESQEATREQYSKTISHLQTELMVFHRADMMLVESPTELAMLVVHYTRALAEAPYKKAKRDIDEQAEFYMRGDNKNCVAVDKDGNGLGRLWEQMIAVLPNSSLEVARTLGAVYKKPSALVKEFQSTGGLARVADIGVTRSNVPGAKPRRLGPELARRLHTLFTTEDGDLVIE